MGEAESGRVSASAQRRVAIDGDGLAPCHFTLAARKALVPRASVLSAEADQVLAPSPARLHRTLRCLAGRYLPANKPDAPPSEHLHECIPCSSGMFTDFDGASICKECVVGKYATHTGNINCTDCRPGTHAEFPGSRTCSECQQGQFSADWAAATCKLCAKGRAADYARSSCPPCRSGYAAPKEGMAQCSACNPGSFSNGTGNGKCTPCSPGTTMELQHAQGCTACAEGKAQPKSGGASEHCPACQVGFFSNAKGAKECISCGISMYNDEENSLKCLSCLTIDVEFGFGRPEQCLITYMLLYSLLGFFAFACILCCWSKMGFPCCCCKKKKKEKGARFKTSRSKIPTPIRRGTPSDWEFARGTHSSRKSLGEERVSGIIEIPNQIPIKMSREEERLRWGHENPMHSA